MIYETDVRALGNLRCRVQVRRCLDGSIQQRHVWLVDNDGPVDPPRYDRWIASCSRSLESATRNMTPAPHEPDEHGILVEALQRIADGHNDPRALAAAALSAAGLIRG